MKKSLIPTLTVLSVTSISAAIAYHINHSATALTSLSQTSAAKFGNWLYEVAPARPEFLLPACFLAAVLALAAIAAHHLREDQRLNELQVLGTRKPKYVVRTPSVRRRPVSASLVPSRAH